MNFINLLAPIIRGFLLLQLVIPMAHGKYPESDHYDGKIFYNPQGDDLKSFWDLLKWKWQANVNQFPDHVENKKYSLPQLSSENKVICTFVNHATFLIQYKNLTILTDPVYAQRASPVQFAGPKRVRKPGLSFEELPNIDVVAVSHNHYDHLDIDTLKALNDKFHPLFLVPLGDEKKLTENNITHFKALDWWEELRIKDVLITFAPAQHWSARHLWDKNKSLWGSYMFDDGRFKIYHAGDTGMGPHFEQIKKKLGTVDLALLPIGAYKPRWFMKHYHMDPSDAVLAHQILGAKKSLAMHFGTFQLTDEGIDEPALDLMKALEAEKISSGVFIVPDQGESFLY
jgi:L-ascorbate metabolism protein UlaG (beta-lactamase superfamily)